MNMTKTTLKRFLPAVLMVLALVACHNDGLTRDQRRARRAAERCYRYLQNGKYDRFVSEIAYADQMSPEYRSQMQDHGNLISFEAVGDTIQSDLAHIYLQLTYADSTSEEVGLPMICIDGDWKMQ